MRDDVVAMSHAMLQMKMNRTEQDMQVQRTDYAMRILRHLHVCQGDVQTGAAIAKSVGITYPIFTRISNRLRMKGLLASAQGRNDGYVLGKPATKISVYDVFSAMEGELSHCLSVSDERHGCEVYEYLNDLQNSIVAHMSDKFIADL